MTCLWKIVVQVKWVNKGAERGETLVSISTDGRVVEWSMKKGLSFSPLMVLKRIECITNPKSDPIPDPSLTLTATEVSAGVISRQASGLSFDFPPGDGATYNEQYLETYHGHTGPVYRIRCSPFCDRLFLSCRYDSIYTNYICV
ncbi:unnamed protein product [Laminaria digitata]